MTIPYSSLEFKVEINTEYTLLSEKMEFENFSSLSIIHIFFLSKLLVFWNCFKVFFSFIKLMYFVKPLFYHRE